MNADEAREQELRRLLAEAVEPVEPGPGAQTRLLAKARSQAQRKRRRRRDVLRWAAPVVLGSLAVIFLATVAVVGLRHAGESSKGSSTSATGASAPSAAAGQSRAPLAAAASKGADSTVASPAVPPPVAPTRSMLNATSGSATTEFSNSQPKTAALVPDLDGDGRADTFAISGENLVAQLSTDGSQTVSLPPTGAGARALAVTTLSDPSGNHVPVLFVRLQQSGSTFTDTVVALVSGRLTVLQKGSDPLLLTVDATHGYGCNQSDLAIAGDATPYVVDGSQLVPAPQLRAVAVPAGKSGGCY